MRPLFAIGLGLAFAAAMLAAFFILENTQTERNPRTTSPALLHPTLSQARKKSNATDPGPLGNIEALRKNITAWSLALKPLNATQLLALFDDDARLSYGSIEENQRAWQVIYTAALDDPLLVIAWLRHRSATPDNNRLWEAAVEGWTKADIEGAFAFIQSHEDVPNRENLLRSILSSSLRSDATWFKEHLASFPTDTQYRIAISLAWNWAVKDPEAAARWIVKFPVNRPEMPMKMSSVFTQWAKQNPQTAWKFVDALEAPYYEAALPGYARGIVLRNLDEGVTFLADLKASGRQLPLYTIGVHCAQAAPDRGAELLPRLSDPKDRREFADAFVSNLGRSQPQRALTLLSETTPSERAGIEDEIARAWATKEGPAAFAWAIAEPDENHRLSRIAAAVSSWSKKDPDLAWENANSLLSSKEKVSATQAWCISVAEAAPLRSMMAARIIPDNTGRTETMRTVADIWKQTDHRGFSLWLKNAPAEDLQILEPSLSRTP